MFTSLRKAVAAASLVAIAAVSLTACGADPTSPSEGGSPVTMWGLGQAPLNGVLEDSIARWNQDNADEQIDSELFAGEDLKTKLRTAIGAGSSPTFIFSWGGGVLNSYVQEGDLLDLTPYVAEHPELASRYPTAVSAAGVIDGKTWAIPNSHTQPVLMYYNKQVFADAGVEPPKTWDDLIALVPVFKAKGIAPFSIGGQSRWPELMWLEYLVERIGGPEVFNAIAANEPDAWSNPAVLDALGKIQQLVDAGAFADGFSSIAADTRADLALVYTGKAAMIMHLASGYSGVKADAPDFVSSGNLGFLPFPEVVGGKGDPANLVGNPAMLWAISSTASDSQIETAIDYLTNGTFDETYTQGLIDAGAVPAVSGVQSKLAASPDSDFQSTLYDMVENAPNFQLSWDQALTPEQSEAMLTNLTLIFLGQQTPDEFVAAMNATIQK